MELKLFWVRFLKNKYPLFYFRDELTDVEAYSSQLEVEWNCNKNILYLRPRDHNVQLKKGQFHRADVLFTGINETEMKNQMVRDKGKQSLMWFNSKRSGKDANCLHYDFEYGKQFCDDEVTTTIAPTTTKATTKVVFFYLDVFCENFPNLNGLGWSRSKNVCPHESPGNFPNIR